MIFKEVTVDNKLFKETWINNIDSSFPSSSYEYVTFGNTHTSEKDYFLISTDNTNKVVAVVYLSTISHSVLRVFKLKVLSLGNQVTNGLSFWFDNSTYFYKDFLQSLTIYIKKNISCQIILLKDFKEDIDTDFISVNSELGFYNFNTFSRAYKFLEPSFDEYLSGLNSKKRMFLKKEIVQTVQQNNLIIQNVEKVTEEELKILYQLYKNVSLNAKEIKVKAFPYSFFQKINTHFKKTNYVIVYVNQKISGFGLLLKHKNVSRCFCLGLDYEYAKQNNLWYVIVLNAIQHSIEYNYEKIEFGNSNFAMKRKFGAIEERVIFSIRLKNNKLNNVLSPLLKKLVNQTFKPKNNN